MVASANPDKAAEIAAILSEELGGGLELVARPAWVSEVDETGGTLEENARLKALALVAATGETSIADDTGLEVDALGGAPGVRTARFAGARASYVDNVTKLLEVLSDVSDRRARFRTVVVCCFPDGSEVVGEGSVSGVIAASPRGTEGFGYDPVFVPDGARGRTFAEMTATEKHRLSHRGVALRNLAAKLRVAEGG